MTRLTKEEIESRSARNKAAWKIKPGKEVSLGAINFKNESPQDVFVSADGSQIYVDPVKPSKNKKTVPTEHQEQCAVIAWCDQHPVAKHIFAIPNGANKSPASAAKFKREGLRKGVPDLFLPVASRGFHGLFIEMKRVEGSRATMEQVEWATRLTVFGYDYQLCYGADEAIEAIGRYLSSL